MKVNNLERQMEHTMMQMLFVLNLYTETFRIRWMMRNGNLSTVISVSGAAWVSPLMRLYLPKHHRR